MTGNEAISGYDGGIIPSFSKKIRANKVSWMLDVFKSEPFVAIHGHPKP